MNVNTVPRIPNLVIFMMFSKKFFLRMLYPVAKMIKGRRTSKNKVPLNPILLIVSWSTFSRNNEIPIPSTMMTPVS